MYNGQITKEMYERAGLVLKRNKEYSVFIIEKIRPGLHPELRLYNKGDTIDYELFIKLINDIKHQPIIIF